MHGPEPIQEGQLGGFHDRAASQRSPGPARFTLKLTDVFHLVMVGSFTLPADNSFFLTIHPEKIPARLLVKELGGEIDKLHNHNFDMNLLGHNVTYLRFGSF